ncbi:hypothetical protein ASG29_05820 [Sphingomonas sp. Leaf412]|uniref:hypothetical protein n=1 Tax=Sphingomonas sp. Leaf412 TaxID=1736370 RepID=UPI0006F9822C|nr:hypothetical protein [Sphingomonas sp. Leaf412]KQT33551.1 hypothetical protein ASG29_05820 [Sphingomonas sp. Leaf412]
MTVFEQVHAMLRAIMLASAADQSVTRDEPGDLIVRTNAMDEKGQSGWFGTVTIRKSYVAYHLMPLYDAPDLAADLSPGLRKRRQGKTCFNFTRPDDALFAELAALTAGARGTLP